MTTAKAKSIRKEELRTDILKCKYLMENARDFETRRAIVILERLLRDAIKTVGR